MKALLFCALFFLPFSAILQSQPQSSEPQSSEPQAQLAALAQQASQRLQAGDADGALKAQQTALEIAQKSFGPAGDETSQVCLNIADIYRAAYHLQEAVEWMRRAIANHGKNGDTKSVAYGMALQKLGETYLDTTANRLALETFQEANKVLMAALPEKDLAVVTSWHDLGVGNMMAGHLGEAEADFLKALPLRKELAGKDSVPVAYTEDHLGRLYQQRNEDDKAEPLLVDAARIMTLHEKDMPEMSARFTLDLVRMYAHMFEFEKAEQYLQVAQRFYESHFPPAHQAWGNFYPTRAMLRKLQGRLPEAETDLLKSLEFNEKINKVGAAVANACAGLGNFYQDGGFSTKAEEYLLRALRVTGESNGQNSGYYTVICYNLANFYWGIRHDPQRALPYARAAYEASKTTEQNFKISPELFYGEIALEAGQSDLARSLLSDVRLRFEREHQTESSLYLRLQAELSLAGGAQSMKSSELLQTVIRSELSALKEAEHVSDNDTRKELGVANAHVDVAVHYLMNDQAKEARPHLDKALPVILRKVAPGNDRYRRATDSLVYARFDQGEAEDPELTDKWMAGEMASVENMLSMELDYDREHWVTTEWPFDVLCSIGSARQAALLSLRIKNIILDLDEENRRLARATTTAEGRSLWDKLVQLKAKCREAVTTGALPADVHQLMLAKQDTERELASVSHVQQKVRQALALNLDQLQAALPEDAALIDYVSYSRRARGGDNEMQYAIIVHRKGHEPKLYNTGGTHRQVDYLVDLFRRAMGSPGKNPMEKSEALGELLQQAGADILGPVLPDLAGVKTLIISPDAALQTLPFGVLLDKEGHFYGERFRIQYVTSARDLLRPANVSSPTRRHDIVLFGGAKYRLGTPLQVAQQFTSLDKARSLDLLQDRANVVFTPLPGTARELSLISGLAARKNWTFTAYSEEDASERNLRRLSPAPQVLHIATHGYYFPRPLNAEDIQSHRVRKWPDHGTRITIILEPQRCGLLFAGAQDSINFWQQGVHMPQENDGFLNLEEVQELNLSGTQLVVLSACDSGVGEAVPNGGIASLRSAFLSAGAQHVISTLWPIPDAETADFMAQFYERYMANGRVGISLQETQREWLVKTRQQKGLWMAIKQAGGFILGSSGWEN